MKQALAQAVVSVALSLAATAGFAQGDGIFTFGGVSTPSATQTLFSLDNNGQFLNSGTIGSSTSGGLNPYALLGQSSVPLAGSNGRPHIVYEITPAALDGRIRVRVNPSRSATPPEVYLCTRLDGNAQTGYGVAYDPDALTTSGLARVDYFGNSYNSSTEFTNNIAVLRDQDASYWIEIISTADAISANILDENGTTLLTTSTMAGSLNRSQTARYGYGLLIRGANECCGNSTPFTASFDDLSFMSLSRGSDANNDGKPDLYWRDAGSGNVYQWLMNGTSVSTFRWSGNLPGSQWRFVGAGNVDNVNASDVVWQDDTTGAVYYWALTNGGTIGAWSYIGSPGTAWRASAVADLNYDSLSDIVFRNQETGENVVWFMQAGAITGFEFLPTVADQRYQIIGAADLDWNGQNDLLWSFEFVRGNEVTPDTDLVYAWLLNRTRGIDQFRYLGAITTDWSYVGAGDFDADRRDNDLIWHNRNSGSVAAWYMQSASISSFGVINNVGTTTAWRGGN
jgi:hypothetical protein